MKRVSIEQLLVWAYRDQMVHGARPQGTSAEFTLSYRPGIAQAAFERDKIVTSANAGYDAHDDAYAVHRMVTSLAAVTVMVGDDLAAARHARGVLGDSTLLVSAGMDAAIAWADRAKRMVIHRSALVLLHARNATRPEVLRADFRMKPGRTVIDPVTRRASHCEVRPEGVLPGDAALSRAEYRIWHGALDDLRKGCTAIRFSSHFVSEELPPLCEHQEGS